MVTEEMTGGKREHGRKKIPKLLLIVSKICTKNVAFLVKKLALIIKFTKRGVAVVKWLASRLVTGRSAVRIPHSADTFIFDK